MPSVEVDHRYQSALFWPYGGVDANGQPKHGNPVAIRVRFSHTRREAKRPDGTSVTLDAQAVVGQLIPIDSWFWVDPRPIEQQQYVSSLLYWANTASAAADNERMIVVTYDGTPDLRHRYFQRTIGLMRHHSAGTSV